MKNFRIEVWCLYISFGEIEKNFDVCNIVANDEIEAIKFAKELYSTTIKIPFKFNVIKK